MIFPFNKILSLLHNKNLCVQRSQNFGEILYNPFKYYCIFATAIITSIEVPKEELIQMDKIQLLVEHASASFASITLRNRS